MTEFAYDASSDFLHIKPEMPNLPIDTQQVVPVWMERSEFDSFYNGCCNGTFWPLFHSLPDRAIFSVEHWKSYVQMNHLFAEKTMEAVERLKKERPEVLPLIWIHDYHLTLAAETIRQSAKEKGYPVKLGYFLHIPFPPRDIFRLLPWANQVVEGLLGKQYAN